MNAAMLPVPVVRLTSDGERVTVVGFAYEHGNLEAICAKADGSFVCCWAFKLKNPPMDGGVPTAGCAGAGGLGPDASPTRLC